MSLRCLAIGMVLLLLHAPDSRAEGDAPGALGRISRAKIASAAAEIDRRIDADLEAKGIKPTPPTSDAVFGRRVYLDLIGRIPTGAEAAAFLASSDPDKRAVLIDHLLESPGYDSHLFNWFADLLRVKSKMKAASGEAYIDYLKTEIEENTPYDELVRELLTSSGPAMERGNGAVNYYLRDRGMPEDNMSNTVRIFLGTRLECAQCHNHPFDKWTQIQYFQMVAFTGGLQYKDTDYNKSEVAQHVREIEKSLKGGAGPTQQAKNFNKMMQPLGYGIHGTGTGSVRLPHDYKYPDAKPEAAVTAKTMFGDAVNLAHTAAAPAVKGKRKTPPARGGGAGVGSREAYAEWLTSPKNPRFATVIANRMWKRMMGIGVIEPVDDLRDDTQPSNPALMEGLRNLMVEVGFDLKQYLRTVCSTRAYQRSAVLGDLAEGEPFHFQGPLLRRMSAEQIWDSLLTLVVANLDETLEGADSPEAERVYKEYEELSRLTKEDLQLIANEGKRKAKADMKAKEETPATLELQRKIARAKKKGDEDEVARLTKELEKQTGKPLLMPKKGGRRAGADKDLVRASDLPQPARPGHLVREFGQGDREQIEASHKDPAVPQVLTLLNGFIERRVTSNPRAAINDALSAARSPEEKLKAAFLGVLGRLPGSAEKALWIPDLSAQGASASKDLVATLLNTHEFMFIQ
ncbi:MAG: DUF1549 domain-containing protein [Planctomycetes bacterium]|nr:DUF1549 domain-containing protein [Planctomycetota bacterium]